MPGPPLLLADADRADQFLLIGRSRRLFDGYAQHTDADGIVWAAKTIAGHGFAATWLGPAWVFDPVARQLRAADVQARRAAMAAADPERHRQELDAVVARMRLGPTAERLLWLIHQQVLRLRSSVLQLPDSLLADAVWGGRGRPAHWRKEILAVLQGLTWLHLASRSASDEPAWGADTAVLTHAADLRGTANNVCRDGCGDAPEGGHHHYLVNVGRGFLGVLEVFVRDEDDSGVRSYAFPVGGRRRDSSSLRSVGKSGNLVTIYLPAELGDRKSCDALTPSQHRLLQAVVRETTRATKEDRHSVSQAEVMRGNVIPTIDGRGTFACNLLDPDGAHVGFNGNKLLKGRGYLIRSPGGWMAKAGYSADELSAFLVDLAVLTDKLALIPVGVEPQKLACLDLSRMSALAASTGGTTALRRIHLRIYAPADYLARWNRAFGWREEGSERNVAIDPALAVVSAVEGKVVSQKRLAAGMGVDPSFLNKVLRGKRRWPDGWLDRALSWLSSHVADQRHDPSPDRQPDSKAACP